MRRPMQLAGDPFHLFSPESKRIMEKVRRYADNPASLANNVARLQGRDGLRLRVGDWRVIMNDEGEVLAALKIGPRGGVCD